MLSPGRHAADVVLARAFEDQATGFYVDVGPSRPELGSVTKHFYDRGWYGINVAPMPADHALLCRARPRDINVRLVLSDRVGRGRFYQADENRGRPTLRGDIAACPHESGASVVELDVELASLADVCARHAPGPIDFLRVEVDGRETQVIGSGDWVRHRPRVVLVGATEPGSTGPSHAAWEPVLLAAGYQLALFDGVTRFYVRDEDTVLMPRLATPAKADDAWETRRYVSKIAQLERQVASLEQQVTELQAHSGEAMRYATDVREHFERCQARAMVLEDKVRSCEEHLSKIAEMERYVAALQAQSAEQGRYAADVQEHFERCQAWAMVLEDKVRSCEEHLSKIAEMERYAADVQEHFERGQVWVNVLESKVRCFEEYLGLLPGTLPPPRA